MIIDRFSFGKLYEIGKLQICWIKHRKMLYNKFSIQLILNISPSQFQLKTNIEHLKTNSNLCLQEKLTTQ